MAETSKIQGYDIKDATARGSIVTIGEELESIDNAVGELQEDVSGITERLDFYLQVNPIVTTGTKIATLSVENVDYDLYAPQGSSAGGVQSVSGTNSAICTTDASGNVTVDVAFITTGKAANATPASRATVEGMNNTVDAPASHAEGTGNTISQYASQCAHAEGTNNTVNGINGHAEGYNNTVDGQHSHAEGSGNTTTGNYSHAGGSGSVAAGNGSMAQGYYTKTLNVGELAVGSYNKSDSLTRFSVGNGNSDSNRSNLFEVTSAGSAIVSGELHVGDDVYVDGQNIYIDNASGVQKEISINASNQLCIDSIPISGGSYVLPTASASTLGGVKVGTGLSIDGNGVLSASGGGGGSHTYSTTEQVVGTWIDGKPLYEKTIFIGNVARNNSASVSSGVSDIDKVIELKGIGEQIADNSAWADYNQPQGFIPIPNYRSTTYYCGIAISSSNNIGINLTSDYQRLDNCYAIIRYTKTTDTPNA